MSQRERKRGIESDDRGDGTTIGSVLLPDLVRRRILLKLGVLFAVTVLAIGVVGAYTYTTTSAQLTDDTKTRLESAAVLQSETLGEWVGRMKLHATSMTHSNAVQERRNVGTYLTRREAGLPDHVVGVYYVDTTSGAVLASSDEGGIEALSNAPLDDVDRAGAAESEGDDRGGHARVLDPYRTGRGVPAVGFAAPVDGQDDRAVVIVANLSARSEALVRPAGASSFTHVVDSNGSVVMSHRTGGILGQNMGPRGEGTVESMAVERGIRGRTGYMEMDMEGATMTMGFAPVEGTDWVVMSHQPKSEAFALRDDTVRNTAALVLVSLGALGVVGVVVGRATGEIRALSARARRVSEGDYDVTVESDRPDEVGQLFADVGTMRDSLQRRLEEAERLRAETEALNDHLEAKAVDFGARMRRCAEGDLTRRMDPDSESEAMTRIAAEFNGMMDDIERTVASLQAFAERVETVAAELDAGAEEVADASEQVASSIGTIADGAARQSENLGAISTEMEGLSTTIEEIASTTNEVANSAEAAAETGREGREAARTAVEGMTEIRANSKEAVGEMDRLREAMDEIDELLDIVSGIADETNRLALNANIEAAKGGDEDGNGFAVVADEIRSLAEDAKSATREIEGRLDTVTEQAERSGATVDRTAGAIAEQADSVEAAIEAFEEIANLTEETNAGIQEISSATNQQAAATEEVVAMVDEVAAISQETTTEAGNVAGAAEEQTSATTNLAENATDLAERSADLRESLDRFIVSSDD